MKLKFVIMLASSFPTTIFAGNWTADFSAKFYDIKSNSPYFTDNDCKLIESDYKFSAKEGVPIGKIPRFYNEKLLSQRNLKNSETLVLASFQETFLYRKKKYNSSLYFSYIASSALQSEEGVWWNKYCHGSFSLNLVK